VKLVRFIADKEIKNGILIDERTIKAICHNLFDTIHGDILSNRSVCCDIEYTLDDVVILPPCLPSKIVAIGLNYLGHAKERDKEHLLPSEPLIFLKPPTAVIASGDAIVLPCGSEGRVYYEGELAVVIGKKAKDVSEAQAREYVLGYTCFNDVSEKYFQKLDVQWTRGKGFDTFAPFGPCIETDLSPDNLKLETYVNDVLCQVGFTSDLIFGIDRLVSFVSSIMTLLPGDIIATGTPAGVGRIISGDIVKVKIEGIGTLSNSVRTKDLIS